MGVVNSCHCQSQGLSGLLCDSRIGLGGALLSLQIDTCLPAAGSPISLAVHKLNLLPSRLHEHGIPPFLIVLSLLFPHAYSFPLGWGDGQNR